MSERSDETPLLHDESTASRFTFDIKQEPVPYARVHADGRGRTVEGMASHPRPTTIAEYIERAPPEGQPHLHRLYAILKEAAPHATEAIKWGTPFFVEPRFLFAFSAHKAHLDFTPTEAGLAPFRVELGKHKTTKNMLQVPYKQALPEELIRTIAMHRVRVVREREDDSFW
ncbi:MULTISPECIES: iron chaperone [unclassified Variovorax]|uniref:iron chaperone n=1 Tax=unclassified Variovorax TaxID=663243 RepID=UPI001BD5326F|nr:MULTISPECIES: DUF1801 domain-containing protein [unclassified Variovorax]